MTDTKIPVEVQHSTIGAALAAAQMQMGRALKSANNPHFKSKYADLASVMEACMPALNNAGIAVIQPTTDEEAGRYVETILIHGASGETLKCRVPLIVGKNDMQGYGSAVTYARRYGLMSMAGIAPEDDDGNAAAKAAPVAEKQPDLPKFINAEQYVRLRAKVDLWGGDEAKFLAGYKADSLHEFPLGRFAEAMTALQKRIDEAKPAPADDLAGDEIPY
ncbi:MAG: ERF family protein [Loktanella sp.]|nr:ERF family protein [Loktanella sp.]